MTHPHESENGATLTPEQMLLRAVRFHIEILPPDGWLGVLVSSYREIYDAATDVDPEATCEMLQSVSLLAQAVKDYALAIQERGDQ